MSRKLFSGNRYRVDGGVEMAGVGLWPTSPTPADSWPVGAGGERDGIQLADAWAAHVEKIDRDRALAWSDPTVWNEHDLCAALLIRDRVREAVRALPGRSRGTWRGGVEPPAGNPAGSGPVGGGRFHRVESVLIGSM